MKFFSKYKRQNIENREESKCQKIKIRKKRWKNWQKKDEKMKKKDEKRWKMKHHKKKRKNAAPPKNEKKRINHVEINWVSIEKLQL